MTKSLFFLLVVLISPSLANPTISYFWLGGDQIPQKYQNKLLSLTYPYELILTCDIVIDKMQQLLGRRFKHKTFAYNQLADICRYSHLYFYGGTYSDLDVDLNYTCYQKVMANQTSAWPSVINRYGSQVLDNYFFSELKGSQNLLWLIKNFDQHNQLQQINSLYTKNSLPKYNMGSINPCVVHHNDGSFWKKANALKYINITSESIYWTITWLIMITIATIFHRMINQKLRTNNKGKSNDAWITQLEVADNQQRVDLNKNTF